MRLFPEDCSSSGEEIWCGWVSISGFGFATAAVWCRYDVAVFSTLELDSVLFLPAHRKKERKKTVNITPKFERDNTSFDNSVDSPGRLFHQRTWPCFRTSFLMIYVVQRLYVS